MKLRYVERFKWFFDSQDPNPYQKYTIDLEMCFPGGGWRRVPHVWLDDEPELGFRNHRFELNSAGTACEVCGHTFDWHQERNCGFE